MVQKYNIAGRQIGSHYLAMATLTALFGGVYASTGGSKPKTTATPPINAGSAEESDFIKNFLESADKKHALLIDCPSLQRHDHDNLDAMAAVECRVQYAPVSFVPIDQHLAELDTTASRAARDDIVCVVYDGDLAGAVAADARYALVASAGPSGNALFGHGCAVVVEGGSDVLYATSGLLQRRDARQPPAVLISRLALRRVDGQLASAAWHKLRPPPAMHAPAGLTALRGVDQGDQGIVYACQGAFDRRSAGLVHLATGRPPSVVTDAYHGLDYNSPLDVVQHPVDGSLWFTDPTLGFAHDIRPTPRRVPCVYRVDAPGPTTTTSTTTTTPTPAVRVLLDDLLCPTSLCISPDGATLYVSDSGERYGVPASGIYAYDVVRRGTADFVSNRRVFAHVLRGPALCLRCDAAGHLLAACADGLEIWSPDGAILGVLVPPHGATITSFCFTGPKGLDLLLCCGPALYAIDLGSVPLRAI